MFTRFVANSEKMSHIRVFRGPAQNIAILHRGGCQNLLQHYSFERKMEGYNPFSALNKLKGFHFILFNADLCLRILSQIQKNVANTRF